MIRAARCPVLSPLRVTVGLAVRKLIIASR